MPPARWRRVATDAVTKHEAQQDPTELAQLLYLLDTRQRPQLVLEIGGGTGGSAWAWLQLPTVVEVVTVTTPDPRRQWRCDCAPAQHWLALGDSLAGDTRHQVLAHLMGRRPEFVWVDGNHSRRYCQDDVAWARSIADPAALIGVHDIVDQPTWLDFGVPEVWAGIAEQYRTAQLLADPVKGPGTGLILPDHPRWEDYPDA